MHDDVVDLVELGGPDVCGIFVGAVVLAEAREPARDEVVAERGAAGGGAVAEDVVEAHQGVDRDSLEACGAGVSAMGRRGCAETYAVQTFSFLAAFGSQRRGTGAMRCSR